MMHRSDPRIAFNRMCRLYGGMTLGIVAGQLLNISHWFAVVGLIGVALMFSVVWPLQRELRNGLTAAERDAQRRWKDGPQG